MKFSALKKTVFTVLLSVVAITAFADKKAANAVTMVSYEQDCYEDGIIALKNNTDKEIRNVSFRLVYFDMSGNQLDYRDFNKRINISPGMTRQIEVEGYGKYRKYSYYKSRSYPGNPHRFKVEFRLTGYDNTKIVAKSSASQPVPKEEVKVADAAYEEEPSGVENGMMMFGIIVIVLLTTGISVGLYTLVAVMAQKRNRSMVTWVFVGIIATPVLAIIILLCIGDAYDAY